MRGYLDHNGISTNFVAQHGVISLGRTSEGLTLVTEGEVSEQRRRLLEFMSGTSVKLESLDQHPELRQTFTETIAACRQTMAEQPTTFSESAEEYLERMEQAERN